MTVRKIEIDYPDFSEAEAVQLAFRQFGISGKARELASDRDQNFRIDSPSGSYVLKIANASEDASFIELQNSALEHLKSVAPDLPLPRIVQSSRGNAVETVEAGSQVFLVRLMTYIEGQLFSGAGRSKQLLRSLGQYAGKLSKGLQGFGHVGAHRSDFDWNLDSVLAAEAWVGDIASPDNRRMVQACFDRYREFVLPHLSGLRASVIHNDINDNNIIVSARGEHVEAVIDFGDMVFARQINELAVLLAYALMGQADVRGSAAAIIEAYNQELPLEAEEVDLLFDLVIMRLVLSVCISSHRAKSEPHNVYNTISQQPAFDLLRVLSSIERDELVALTRRACGFPVPSGGDKSIEEMVRHRQRVLGPSLSLAYDSPLKIVRGEGCYLYDQHGKPFLDCVNNVTHVGHCHPHVVNALASQAKVLNTNARYLHDTIQTYADRLLASLPDPLSVVYFVCSGSEANELALRMAKAHTGRSGIIVQDWAYHGNTGGLIDISPYKFNRKGGAGCPDHVRIVELPDPYKGTHTGYEASVGEVYARNIDTVVTGGFEPAAFIAESLAGVGGQIIYPESYLGNAFQCARKVEAVCIADEVQVGFGRVGTHMWAFEQQGAVPDIVTIGKPIGNGHPMAAVVTTREIADSFANGMEYFNTFGGNPVSCAVGMAVLDVIEGEELQARALATGGKLLSEFRALQDRYELIGDVRGTGLFIGIELVKDRVSKAPATAEAHAIVQYCKDQGVLLSTDGPAENVIKIKPPMVFGAKETELLVSVLDAAFHAVGRN